MKELNKPMHIVGTKITGDRYWEDDVQPRNASVNVCMKKDTACVKIAPDKRCFGCPAGVPGTSAEQEKS